MKRRHFAALPAFAVAARNSPPPGTPDAIVEISAAKARSLVGRRNKYGAKRQVVDGHNFPSKAEAARYLELRLLERAGKIVGLELQPRFLLLVGPLEIFNGVPVGLRGGTELINVGTYIADFRYLERIQGATPAVDDWRTVIEDVKGFDTPASKLRRRLAEALHDIRVTIIKRAKR